MFPKWKCHPNAPLSIYPFPPHAQEERVGYIFINILGPNYAFPPPKTPAKCPQQQVSTPSMLSGDYLHMFTYPALPRIPPAQPALLSGTLGICTTLPTYSKDHITNPNQPQHYGKTLFFLAGGEYLVWIDDMILASPGYWYIRVPDTGIPTSHAGHHMPGPCIDTIHTHVIHHQQVAPSIVMMAAPAVYGVDFWGVIPSGAAFSSCLQWRHALGMWSSWISIQDTNFCRSQFDHLLNLASCLEVGWSLMFPSSSPSQHLIELNISKRW